MTRKHFQQIAFIIGTARALADRGESAHHVLDYLQLGLQSLQIQDNPRFNEARFKRAVEDARTKVGT